MYTSLQISALIRSTGEWLSKQCLAIGGNVPLKTLAITQDPADDPTVFRYEGFHGTPSRCHVVHLRYGNRILLAFGLMEDGGTSPTNMIEELATAMWKRFYPKDRFDHIEWFDASPEHCSLTNRFHIQRVHFGNSEGRPELAWGRIGTDVPRDFVKEVRRVIDGRPNLPTATSAMAEVVDHG